MAKKITDKDCIDWLEQRVVGIPWKDVAWVADKYNHIASIVNSANGYITMREAIADAIRRERRNG